MGIEGIGGERAAGDDLIVKSLPKSALQAIYHAATGKTENLSKDINGNVIIKYVDIERLYGMIIDQSDHYEKEIDPVVTIIVKHSNDKSVTYSSWERFNAIQVNNHEITSEVLFKIEFIIRLPNTAKAQRCIVNIDLDSSLPILDKHREQIHDADGFGFFLFLSNKEWKTVSISIDFVDFLIARNFVGIIEEWFLSLEKTPKRKLNDTLFRNYDLIRNSLLQAGRVGMAFFLMAYVFFSGPQADSLSRFVYATSIGLLVWSAFAILDSYVIRKIFRRIYKNIIPAVIVINEGDRQAFERAKENLNQPYGTIAIVITTIIINISLNIFASYIYSYLTGK